MSTAQPVDEFIHPALLYHDEQDYLTATVPFIREGLDRDEPVAVAVPGPNLARLRQALGTDAARVVMHDMTIAGRNPGAIIPTVLLAFADAHPGRRVRIIGEPIWAGRTAAEYPACAQHEALINAAFAGRPATILCPYHTAALDPAWISDAYQTHPVMLTTTERWDSPSYHDPIAVATSFNQPLPRPPADADHLLVDVRSLAATRHLAKQQARQAGLSPQRAADFTIAVNELATNAIAHGGGAGELAIWIDRPDLICHSTTPDTSRTRSPDASPVRLIPPVAAASCWSIRSATSCACTPPATRPPSAPNSAADPTRHRPRT